jgi:hypothetical protein
MARPSMRKARFALRYGFLGAIRHSRSRRKVTSVWSGRVRNGKFHWGLVTGWSIRWGKKASGPILAG